MSTSLYDIPLKKIDGSDTTLAEFKGKVALIVNVASKCGLTPQYESLERTYEQYRDKGLVVLGFPCNDFKGQEPGTEAEIQSFCTTNYGVQFPMFSKVNINSEPRHPLYSALISAQPKATMSPDGGFREKLTQYGLAPKNESDVFWNFEKFLVGKDGTVIGRFSPDLTAESPEIKNAIEKALAA